MTDDAQTIHQILDGDVEAYATLVRKYQDRLFRALVYAAGCAEDAEDVAQEAFFQAYAKLNSFQGHSGFYTWLYRIAFNLLASRRRKRHELPMDPLRMFAECEPVDLGNDPANSAQRAEQAAQVQMALASLTDEYRTILVLREMDGCDYETIAGILELPVGTVRSRLHRARMQLRECLQQTMDPTSTPRVVNG